MCKKYDYLIVGSGLFGSVFAHEATLRGKNALCWSAAITLAAIFIAKRSKESPYIVTVHTFFIRQSPRMEICK